MATKPSEVLGRIDCMVCGEDMPVKANLIGTLNLSCPWCSHSSYAKVGTQAHRIATGWLRKPDREPEPQPAAGDVPVVASQEAATETESKANKANKVGAASVKSLEKIASAARSFSLGDL